MPSKYVFYMLTCRHIMPGKPGATNIYCMRCDADRDVSDIHEYEWAVVCRTGNCRFTRYLGLTRERAAIAANEHLGKTRHSRAVVEYRANPEWVALKQKYRDDHMFVDFDGDNQL